MCSGRLERPRPPWSLPSLSECLVLSFCVCCRPCPGLTQTGFILSGDVTQRGPGF